MWSEMSLEEASFYELHNVVVSHICSNNKKKFFLFSFTEIWAHIDPQGELLHSKRLVEPGLQMWKPKT